VAAVLAVPHYNKRSADPSADPDPEADPYYYYHKYYKYEPKHHYYGHKRSAEPEVELHERFAKPEAAPVDKRADELHHKRFAAP
jgi:hypothetical protein